MSSIEEVRAFPQGRAVDVLEPDATNAGGLTLCRTIAALALAEPVDVVVHSWGAAASQMANLHFSLANRIDSPMNNYDPEKVSGDHSRLNLLRAMKTAVTRVKPAAYFMPEISGPRVRWGKDDHGEQPLFDEMCAGSYSYKYCGFLGPVENSGGAYVIFDGSPGVAPMCKTPLDHVVHGELSSAEFVDSVKREPVLYNRLPVNFIENHDTARVSAVFPKEHRALFVLICAMPGVPVIHAGQEIGSTVHPDASGGTKLLVDWSAADRDLQAFTRA